MPVIIYKKTVYGGGGGTNFDSVDVADKDVSLVKDVPFDVLDRAKVSMIGGITNKENIGTDEEPIYELRTAHVTEVESVGKNLIDELAFKTKSNWVVVPDATQWNSYKLDFAKEKNYIFSANLPTNRNLYIGHVLKGDTYSVSSRIGKTTTITTQAGETSVLKVDFDEKYDYYLVMTNINGLGEITNIQFEEDDGTGIPSEYTPYISHTLSIPEAVQALDGYGDGISDTVYNYVDWEKKQFVRKVDKKVLNGTENFRAYGSTEVYFRVVSAIFDDGVAKSTTICSHFSSITNLASFSESCFCMGNGSSRGSFCLTYDFFTTETTDTERLNTFKQYLADQYEAGTPITVVYELAEPVVTDISDILGDNSIQVEAGGTLTFVNEHEYAVPNEISFFKNNFVGILTGTAEKAIYDSYGNKINIGKTDISSFGDGTLTGAIAALATMLTQVLPANMSMYSMERSAAEPDEIEVLNTEPENIEPETLEL